MSGTFARSAASCILSAETNSNCEPSNDMSSTNALASVELSMAVAMSLSTVIFAVIARAESPPSCSAMGAF